MRGSPDDRDAEIRGTTRTTRKAPRAVWDARDSLGWLGRWRGRSGGTNEEPRSINRRAPEVKQEPPARGDQAARRRLLVSKRIESRGARRGKSGILSPKHTFHSLLDDELFWLIEERRYYATRLRLIDGEIEAWRAMERLDRGAA